MEVHRVRVQPAAARLPRETQLAWKLDPDPARKAFGGRADITLDDDTLVSEERLVANAHPNGRRPWRWPDYLGKLEQLTDGRLSQNARERFVDLAARLGRLSAEELRQLNPALPAGTVVPDRADGRGIV